MLFLHQVVLNTPSQQPIQEIGSHPVEYIDGSQSESVCTLTDSVRTCLLLESLVLEFAVDRIRT